MSAADPAAPEGAPSVLPVMPGAPSISPLPPDAPSSSPLPPNVSYHALWAALSMSEDFGRFQKEAEFPTCKTDAYHLLPITSHSAEESYAGADGYHVGIIGAGVAGMFTAMIFDHLKETYGLNVTYEILEAEEERVGGRLYTYKFPSTDCYPAGPHDYYDVGAMRFPETPVMKRTFDLFTRLGMGPSQDPKNPKTGDLISYKMRGPNQPTLFNDVQVVQQPVKCEITQETKYKPDLSAAVFNVPDIPEGWIRTTGAGDLVAYGLRKIMNKYENQKPEDFWSTMKKCVDPFSARQYLKDNGHFDNNTIEFLETLDFGCRWYDQGASELVLETLDFGDEKTTWWCIEGGSSQIALNMQKKIKRPEAFCFKKRVTGISYTDSAKTQIDVTVDGETKARTYDAVFNSAPLGAMQHMQLEGLNLNWGTKQAIRNLGYSASCKVGVRFRTLWWKENGLNITRGGVGKTDLPIHFCVYPSYNIDDPVNKPGVLLASYTWSQEADRMGAIFGDKVRLREVITHDLARLHAKTKDKADYDRLYGIIHDNWIDAFPYDWSQNPNVGGGAFAFFGPKQFTYLYNQLTNSEGRYIIIGEAASAHHAWVVGALESAARGVYQFLIRASRCTPKGSPERNAFEAYNNNKMKEPFGPIPVEFNRPWFIKLPEDHKANYPDEFGPTGEFARLGVLWEELRLKQQSDTLDFSKVKLKDLKSVIPKGFETLPETGTSPDQPEAEHV